MDCSTALNGSYCFVCGQRKQRRVASVHSLVHEYVSGVVDWDSRVWRTLWPLFTKPGYLTKTYMEGKRERHSPPVRLYLISSIIFFLLISIAPRNFLNDVTDAIESRAGEAGTGLELGIDSKLSGKAFKTIIDTARAAEGIDVYVTSDDDDESDTADTSDVDMPERNTSVESPSAVAPEIIILDQRDVASADDPQVSEQEDVAATVIDEQKSVVSELERQINASVSEVSDSNGTPSDNAQSEDLDVSVIEIKAECQEIRDNVYDPGFEFLRMPAYRFCLSVSTWRGLIAFIDELVEKLPTALLILLPLMAFVNKILYLFSRRYYVEHLLYYVHNYSFMFLFTILLMAISTVFGWFGVGLGGLLTALGMLYVIYYFLKSMRVVYGQGYLMTISKWLAILIVFFVLATLVFVFFLLGTAAAHGL